MRQHEAGRECLRCMLFTLVHFLLTNTSQPDFDSPIIFFFRRVDCSFDEDADSNDVWYECPRAHSGGRWYHKIMLAMKSSKTGVVNFHYIFVNRTYSE